MSIILRSIVLFILTLPDGSPWPSGIKEERIIHPLPWGEDWGEREIKAHNASFCPSGPNLSDLSPPDSFGPVFFTLTYLLLHVL